LNVPPQWVNTRKGFVEQDEFGIYSKRRAISVLLLHRRLRVAVVFSWCNRFIEQRSIPRCVLVSLVISKPR
jgi:hypothetical protein